MSIRFDYSSRAKIFTGRFPLVSYLMVQMTFWIAAEVLLGVVVYLTLAAVRSANQAEIQTSLQHNIVLGVVLGILYGTLLGLSDYYFDKKYLRTQSMGLLILLRTIYNFFVFIILFLSIRYFFFEIFFKPLMPVNAPVPNELFWKYTFYLFMIYNFVMIIVINFINQVNKKYGPGVLLPLLLGRYRNPKEEEKIFMFMDLRSSTTIAENLGHLKYSAFIRDSFMDINGLLNKFRAQIYQYVGDEIVLTWEIERGLKRSNCLGFFYACTEKFAERADYYTGRYGSIPEFKAGIHIGKITTVEIGDIKRDLAHFGDTINTTARIQSICNSYNSNLLISKILFDSFETNNSYEPKFLGMIQLKGRHEPIEIVSISKVNGA